MTTITMNMNKVVVENGKANYVQAQVTQENILEVKGLKLGLPNDPVCIKQIPVRLLAFDTRYQIMERVNRSKEKLIANFDIRKMVPLVGVIHDDEGCIAILDGVGRLTATQVINPIQFSTLPVMILTDAPTDPKERLLFEADYYEMQDQNNAKLTALQKHGARLIKGDPGATILEEMRDKYNLMFGNSSIEAQIKNTYHYSEFYNIAKRVNGRNILDFILEVMIRSRMSDKPFGRTSYIIRPLDNIYRWYGNVSKEFLVEYFRPMNPKVFKANAVTKYPMLDYRMACSLFLEDLLVEELGLPQKHIVDENGNLIEVA